MFILMNLFKIKFSFSPKIGVGKILNLLREAYKLQSHLVLFEDVHVAIDVTAKLRPTEFGYSAGCEAD